MQTFLTTLSQISYLFLLIGAGFAIMKLCKLPAVATNVLSKLVSTLFMPALILTNFINHYFIKSNFTAERKRLFQHFLCITLTPFARSYRITDMTCVLFKKIIETMAQSVG